MANSTMPDEQNNIAPINPPMSPEQNYQEINAYVVFWGLFYASIFALAISYIGLKIGAVVDAFAPVAALAMGMSAILKRENAFPENVHIQAIASAGSNVLGGTLYIIPAFFLLDIDISFLQVALPNVLGALLGVFLAAIYRRYFCEEMHYVYPFPSGRAAAGVLTCNEGGRLKLMLASGIIGMAFDFIINSLGWWKEVLSTTSFKWGQALVDKTHLAFALDTDVTMLGIGYFTGLRYAATIAAGSFFVSLVCIPIIYYLGGNYQMILGGKQVLLDQAPLQAVTATYIRPIGIGAIAMSGIIGLLSMLGVVSDTVKVAIADIFKLKAVSRNLLRTQQDIPLSISFGGLLLITSLLALLFHMFYSQNIGQTLIVFTILLVLNFLLSVVGISSIAFCGCEPVSGLTILMILISGGALGAVGMHGSVGTLVILILAGFICTSLATSANFMSELKVAHLLGATPRKMEKWQLLSSALSVVLSIAIVVLLNKAYGFSGQSSLLAPQANAIAAITKPLMEGGAAHIPLYMAGAFLAIILWMIKVPPLAFALGVYLPMLATVPMLIGGLISHFVANSSKDKNTSEQRSSEGNTIASGLIAGGAIGSLASAVMSILGINFFLHAWSDTTAATIIGILVYIAVCVFLYRRPLMAKSPATETKNPDCKSL